MSQKITWYSPHLDSWDAFHVRPSPVIGKSDGGARKIGLRIDIKDPPSKDPQSLLAVVDGQNFHVPIALSDNQGRHPSRCHITEIFFLQNQEALIRAIARSRSAELTLGGHVLKLHYRLTDQDFEIFRRMVALLDQPDLPAAPLPDAPPPALAGVYRAGVDGVSMPELIFSTKITPRYPKDASDRGLKGDVVLGVVVRKDGTLDHIEVLRPAIGDCGFEESAIEAVRHWRYKPAIRQGEPVDVWFTVVVTFS